MNLTKEQIFKLYDAVGYTNYFSSNRAKLNKQLILRKFEDMTEEERDILKGKYDYSYNAMTGEEDDLFDTLQSILYKLSIGIDLFEAIEQGFAINEKDLK